MIPRLYIAGAIATLVLAGAGGLYLKGRHDAAERAKAAVAAAQAGQVAAETTTRALDAHTTEVRIIRERSDRDVQIVQQAPSADTAIDPDLRRAWLDGLRHGAPDGEASAPGEPDGTLPPT